MRGLRVLLCLGMISLLIVFSGYAMHLGSVIVVFGSVVMCVLRHYFSFYCDPGDISSSCQ
jgi:hypothetical protein